MDTTARRVLIEYRIPKARFAEAVRHYAGLFIQQLPDPLPEEQLLIEVFKVPNDDEYFQCELCLTCVPDTVGAQDAKPLVFWGSDANDDPPPAPEAAAEELPAGGAMAQEPATARRRSFAERRADVLDAFGNRVGFITNPDYP